MELPLSRMIVSVVVLERRTSAQVPCGASSIADASFRAKPVQGGSRHLLDQGGRLRPGPSAPEPLGQADDLHPRGRRPSSAGSAPPQTQSTGHRPPTRDNTPPGTLPWNEGGSRCPSPVTTTSAAAIRESSSISPTSRSNPGTSRAPRTASPPASPPAAPAPGNGVDIDPEVAPVLVGQGPSRSDSRTICSARGALLGAEDPGRLAEWRRDITGHGQIRSQPTRSAEPTAWTAPHPPSVVAEPPQPTMMRRAPASRAASRRGPRRRCRPERVRRPEGGVARLVRRRATSRSLRSARGVPGGPGREASATRLSVGPPTGPGPRRGGRRRPGPRGVPRPRRRWERPPASTRRPSGRRHPADRLDRRGRPSEFVGRSDQVGHR